MEELYKGTVTGYGYSGEGVLRHDGKVVFLPYALKGEEVEFALTKQTSSFDRGRVVNVLKISPLRENPPCQYFGECGGCSFQHTSYLNELEIKKQLLTENLKKLDWAGEIAVIPSDFEYGYRNKVRFFVGENGLSLKKERSDKLCKINKCLLISNEMNFAIKIIDEFLVAQNLCDNYKEIIIRQEKNELAVLFFVSGNKKVDYQNLYLRLGENYGIFEGKKGVVEHKIGLKCIESEEFGLKCEFKPNSFHQVNKFVGEKLYREVLKNIAGSNVINCYSGAGVLSGIIAKQSKNVIGIELGKSEHEDAESLKKKNNLNTLTNYCGDCGDVLPKLEINADTIIVDPPRSGLSGKVINAINEKNSERLIYISCNAATCIRDIGKLTNYSLNEVKLFDMFARTGEYEVLAILDRK